MRIALFHNSPAGGAKRALFEHARHLVARGHTVDAYTLSTASEGFLPLHEAGCAAVRVCEFPRVGSKTGYVVGHPLLRPVWRLLGPHRLGQARDLAYTRRHGRELAALVPLYGRLAAEIDANGYDVAYVHQCILSQSPHLLSALKTPTVYFCHDTLRYVYEWASEEHPQYDAMRDGFYAKKWLGGVHTRATLRLYAEKERQYVRGARAADVVLANSWYSREAILRTTGVNARVCYLGVDSDFFRPDPSAAREHAVLSVGDLRPHKRHDFVLEAVASIPAARRPAMRIIGYDIAYGTGELSAYALHLLARAKAQGVDLRIDKEVTDEALRAAYRRAGVVAFAPYLEPFGFIPLEAMACGTPVVGVREGGIRESVEHEVTGLLSDRDPEAFGDALDRIVNDAPRAAEMGRNGREAARTRWTWDRSVDLLERVFEQTARPRSAAPATAVVPAHEAAAENLAGNAT